MDLKEYSDDKLLSKFELIVAEIEDRNLLPEYLRRDYFPDSFEHFRGYLALRTMAEAKRDMLEEKYSEKEAGKRFEAWIDNIAGQLPSEDEE